jgi:hypothetical protein
MKFSRHIFPIAFVVTMLTGGAPAARTAGPWDHAARELAGKIARHVPPRTPMGLEVENRSSLKADEVGDITQALRMELRGHGARILEAGRPQARVVVTISQNLQGLVWVAEISRRDSAPGENPPDVEMIQVARLAPAKPLAPAATTVIRKTLVYGESEPILDLAALPPAGESAPRMLVLDRERVSVLTKQESGWAVAASAPLTRSAPWPRDPRGRLVARQDGQFEAYTPGTRCQGRTSPALTLECHASDDLWPLRAAGALEMSAHFVPGRNYFDGKLTLNGEVLQEPNFFSAAAVPDAAGTFLALAGLDGQTRIFGRKPEPLSTTDDWGSDLAAVESGCASGWQILATRAGDAERQDSVQAWSLRNGAPVEASLPVEFPGPVTALWPAESRGAALAVVRDLETGNYEAFTLSISCGD